ncbi:MAG: flagellar hook protein FliD, partial [Legionella sp.]
SDLSQFYTMKSSLSDPDYLSTTVTSQASKGSYQIEIQKLAQQQSLATNYIPDLSNVGSGAITITLGTYNVGKTTFTANPDKTPVTINIAPGNGSLVAIRDAINNSHAGVNAAIVVDSTGSRLTLTSADTGEKYAIKISGGVSALNYDPTTGVNTLTEIKAAQNSVIKINGLTLNQSTNQIKEAITGVTLNLKKEELGKIITFNVDDNKDQLSSLVNEFIKQYNDSITLLSNLTGYNAAAKKGGLFQGDPQLRSIKTGLHKLATTPLATATGNVRSLADLGIITNSKNGLLELKQDKFNKALADNYKDIGPLFAKTAGISDPNIRLKNLNTSIKAGVYFINLSSYTPGVSMEGTIGGLSASSSDGKVLNGSGALTGLSLEVLSGSAGARGGIQVKDGIAVMLNHLLDTYTGLKGDLDERSKQLNNEVTKLDKKQLDINAKTISLNNRYLKQFSKLDALLTQLTNTSNSLTQQLATLPSLKLK